MTVLGCIADDFTGASDAASFLVKGGMSVKLFNGIPTSVEKTTDAQAIVIALKSRTAPKEEAVAESLAAARFLLSQNVKQIYFKYCSTFDSTPEGNIGPVTDALLELLHADYTILCPALPVNGRIVENGNLIVNGIPLHESHMKNHPLTPMWDSSISSLMKPQGKYSCVNLKTDELSSFKPDSMTKPFYVVPDYVKPDDGLTIARSFSHLPLLTGGSGLLEPLAAIWREKLAMVPSIPESATRGKALLLAGSCSQATLNQIAWYQKQNEPCYKLDPIAMMEARQTIDDAWDFIEKHTTDKHAVLVYSSDTPDKVKEYQRLGIEKVSSMLENATAELAVRAINSGYTRIISAGGETSGAITKGLGFSSYWTGESVAPGVPIMIPTERTDIRLILKSGNFGKEDFFSRALFMTTDYDEELEKKLESAVWVAHSLFERGKTAGSSANLSFSHKDKIYISASGSCFGTLKTSDFAIISKTGKTLNGKKPSKEWPLHLALYEKASETGAVIHTHSTYATLWSFVPHLNEQDCLPDHTPYLKMKLGTIGLIPYEKPGSEKLFAAFRANIHTSDGYILKNHGPVVPGKDILDAFYCIEELEESSRIAWELRNAGIKQ